MGVEGGSTRTCKSSAKLRNWTAKVARSEASLVRLAKTIRPPGQGTDAVEYAETRPRMGLALTIPSTGLSDVNYVSVAIRVC